MTIHAAVPGLRRINCRVPNLQYAADVDITGLTTVDIPPLPAASATAILNAQSIATAGNAAPVAGFNPATTMGKFGRNLTVVASGAATSNVTIEGFDYLGQPMKESFTLNGTTPVVGKKCFGDIARVVFGATAATTINVGTGTKLGIPYKALGTVMLNELVSDVAPTAGALLGGVNTQTLTSDDPRGSYTPHSSVVPDGTRWYRFTMNTDRNNLHGNAQAVA